MDSESQITVDEIVKAYLKAHGYDGLYHPDWECGCWVDDLLLCGSHCGDCKPGVEQTNDDGDKGIGPKEGE